MLEVLAYSRSVPENADPAGNREQSRVVGNPDTGRLNRSNVSDAGAFS
jgi:hypothetical protein